MLFSWMLSCLCKEKAVTFKTAEGGAAGPKAAAGTVEGAVDPPKKTPKKETWLAFVYFWSIWRDEVRQSGISVVVFDR